MREIHGKRDQQRVRSEKSCDKKVPTLVVIGVQILMKPVPEIL